MSIKVEHIQASVCADTGQRIDTLVCSYPRVIHSQLLTHRVFSKNSSSTRAIPLEKAISQILDNPAEYIWTQNQAGMQGKVIPAKEKKRLEDINGFYKTGMYYAIETARKLAASPLNVHKQNAGRLLEPFQNIKIVLTATEWENWDWLRDDPAAQGEIAELARAISKARAEATPMVLYAGEWHVPFVDRERSPQTGEMYYFIKQGQQLSAEEAQLVSMSVCAQTSYRNSDYSLEKALDMKGKLLDCEKVHASPSEHIATPIVPDDFEFVSGDILPDSWPEGITHMDRNRNYWSGNLKGFIQYRQLLSGHDKAKA
jgi:thymidylate synthase ThyX